MTDVCIAFELHQPLRMERNFNESMAKGRSLDELFEIYFNNALNRMILERVAEKCYFPATRIILKNIDRFKHERRKFKVAYGISGVLIEQFERWEPDLLDSFKQLADSGCVEFLCQTYFHSLASLFSAEREEFIEQVEMHRRTVEDVFGQEPTVFENTEFIYNNSIAKTLAELGFEGVFTEGAERVLGWRSPNYVYRAKGSDIKVLLRNYRLSDDIAFRFSARDWVGWPLTAGRYAAWLSATPGQCINIFIDYETLGEHQWPETGIHDFLDWLPREVLKHPHLEFSTPSELLRLDPVGEIDVQDFETLSWADIERSTHAWLGNDMQRTCYEAMRKLEPHVKKTGDEKILELWRFLQVSDHFHYMYTAGGAPGLVHGYFSQQPPREVFWAFMKILSDFYERVAERLGGAEGTSVHMLRVVPPERAFHFHENGGYINLSAHSLDEFRDTLRLASDKSVLFHTACKHFERWVRWAIGDEKLADEIARAEGGSASDLRQNIYRIVERRLRELRWGAKT